MKRTTLIALPLALALSLAAAPARATVDSYLRYYVPYEHIHTGDVCLVQQRMIGEIGIPSLVMARAITAPALQLEISSLGTKHHDINVLSGSKLSFSYRNDSFTSSGVAVLEGTVDLAPLNEANGVDAAGRARTIRQAKLYLLTLAETMQLNYRDKWHLRIEFLDVPEQDAHTGKRLYPQVNGPYSIGSPVLAGYELELLGGDGVCDDGPYSFAYLRAKGGGKADELGGAPSQEPQAAGCAVDRGAGAGLGLFGLLLLGLLRRRRA